MFYFHALLTKSYSRVWHQAIRKALTSNEKFLASALHLPRGIWDLIQTFCDLSYLWTRPRT